MKYAEYILKHIIPEWALMYFNYKAVKAYLSTSGALKEFLLLAKKTKNTQEYKEIKKNVMEMTYMIAKIEADYKEFYKRFHQELEKVKTFINIKYNDLVGKTYKIQLQLMSMNRIYRQLIRNQKRCTFRSRSQITDDLSEQLTLKSLKIKESEFQIKQKQLKELCFKLYHEGVNFDKYLKVNQEAIRKLIKKQTKKFVKINQDSQQLDDCKKMIQDLNIYSRQNKVKQLLFQVEKYLLKHFYQAKPQICKEQLRKYQFQKEKNNRAWFQFGLFTGFSFMLLSFIIFLATQNQLDVLNNKTIYESFPIYRGSLLFILYFWTLAIMVFLWNRAKINYKLYFAFNHHFSTLNEILKRVMTLTSIFLLVSIAYICDISKLGILFSSLKGEDYYPIIIWVSLLFLVFFPSKTFINGKGRIWFYRNIIQSFQMKQVDLRHYFIIQQFTSLIIPFSDLTYTICEYSKGIQNKDKYDNDQYDECFFVSRYFTLALVLLPYCLMTVQVLFLSMKYQNINDYIIEFIRNICSIVLIIFATMSYQKSEFFFYWLGMAICIILLNILSAIKKWDYLKKKNIRKGKISYKTKLIILYAPFAVIQPLSISTSIFGVYDKKEQHSLVILYIGLAELCRRMIVNYYLVDAEHFKNKQTYQTVGVYEFPFDECCQTIRKTQLMQYNSDESESEVEEELENEQMKKEEKEIEIILQEQEQNDNRLNFGLFIQGASTYEISNQVKKELPIENNKIVYKNKLKISELIQKESEKALGDSFLNYDINNFKPDEVQELINFQQIPELDIERLHFNNKHYKEEIKQLYEAYGIKLKK